MSLQDQIAADQAAVVAAQAVLDAANVALAADQAKLAAIQPHLSILDEIEKELMLVEDGVDEALKTALLSVAASISPLLAQMRSLFTE
jgi:hypothetical protein